MKKMLTILLAIVGMTGNCVLVKSSIAVKQASVVSEAITKYTAADYIQDGLVAMWDGIENAGYGIHDDNAKTWKNLIGEDAAAIDPSMFFSEFGLHTIAATGMVLQAKNSTVAKTILNASNCFSESICFSLVPPIIDKSNRKISGGIGGSFVIYLYYNVYDKYWYPHVKWNSSNYFSSSVKYFNTPANIHTISRVTISTNEGKVFVNGAQEPGVYSGTFNVNNNNRPYWLNMEYSQGSGVNAIYHNIRIYNRALSADEIAANYKIDKERFNLQ